MSVQIVPGPYRYRKDNMVNGTPCYIIDSDSQSALAFLCYATKDQRDAEEVQAKAFAAVPDLIKALIDAHLRLKLLNDSGRGKGMDAVAEENARKALELAGYVLI